MLANYTMFINFYQVWLLALPDLLEMELGFTEGGLPYHFPAFQNCTCFPCGMNEQIMIEHVIKANLQVTSSSRQTIYIFKNLRLNYFWKTYALPGNYPLYIFPHSSTKKKVQQQTVESNFTSTLQTTNIPCVQRNEFSLYPLKKNL